MAARPGYFSRSLGSAGEDICFLDDCSVALSAKQLVATGYSQISFASVWRPCDRSSTGGLVCTTHRAHDLLRVASPTQLPPTGGCPENPHHRDPVGPFSSRAESTLEQQRKRLTG